jgi:hypothetical protein
MKIYGEGIYVMRRFAASFIASDPMNMTPLISMMTIFKHTVLKANKTVAAIRRVKVSSNESPHVPLSWLRPCFKKPRRYSICDGNNLVAHQSCPYSTVAMQE